MAPETRAQLLTTPDEVDAFLARHPDAAIFKEGLCHKNAVALQHVEGQLAAREDLPLGLIRVVESRAASDHVAARTGIIHESPQLILFKDGRAVFNRDNWDVAPEAIRAALEAHFSRSPA